VTELHPFFNHENIVDFATMMVKDAFEFVTAEDLLEFIEKPYNWTDDFELWEQFDKPRAGDPKWDGFMDQLMHRRGLTP
jgi:hypothetical protein